MAAPANAAIALNTIFNAPDFFFGGMPAPGNLWPAAGAAVLWRVPKAGALGDGEGGGTGALVTPGAEGMVITWPHDGQLVCIPAPSTSQTMCWLQLGQENLNSGIIN
jgi:hypothetical protein